MSYISEGMASMTLEQYVGRPPRTQLTRVETDDVVISTRVHAHIPVMTTETEWTFKS